MHTTGSYVLVDRALTEKRAFNNSGVRYTYYKISQAVIRKRIIFILLLLQLAGHISLLKNHESHKGLLSGRFSLLIRLRYLLVLRHLGQLILALSDLPFSVLRPSPRTRQLPPFLLTRSERTLPRYNFTSLLVPDACSSS